MLVYVYTSYKNTFMIHLAIFKMSLFITKIIQSQKYYRTIYVQTTKMLNEFHKNMKLWLVGICVYIGDVLHNMA